MWLHCSTPPARCATKICPQSDIKPTNVTIPPYGARQGHKVDALTKSDKVCFTVFGGDFHKDGEWAPYVRSTVVFGRCRLESDPTLTLEKIRALALRYYPSAEEVEAEIARDIRGAQLYVIEIEHLTGKQIKEK